VRLPPPGCAVVKVCENSSTASLLANKAAVRGVASIGCLRGALIDRLGTAALGECCVNGVHTRAGETWGSFTSGLSLALFTAIPGSNEEGERDFIAVALLFSRFALIALPFDNVRPYIPSLKDCIR
jgi:hypothetical protein